MSEHHDCYPPINKSSPFTSMTPTPCVAESLFISTENTDSIVFSIISKFKQRANFGKEKYGTTLDRNDLSTKDWIQHAQEELMDAILYLEKLKTFV